MGTHNICFNREIRKTLCGYPLLSVAMNSSLISRRKHMLWYSLEAPHRGASNEYPQHMFSSRNKKYADTFWLKRATY